MYLIFLHVLGLILMCRRASSTDIELLVLRYAVAVLRTIKGILAAGTETRPAARLTGTPTSWRPLHGSQLLFADVITLAARAVSAEDAS